MSQNSSTFSTSFGLLENEQIGERQRVDWSLKIEFEDGIRRNASFALGLVPVEALESGNLHFGSKFRRKL